MNRIHICQACQNEKHGIKTRRPVEHTCGRPLVYEAAFYEWLDKSHMRKQNIPLHIKYKIWIGQK